MLVKASVSSTFPKLSSDGQAMKLANEGQGAVVVVGDVNIQEKVDSRFIDLVNQKIGSEYKVDRILFIKNNKKTNHATLL